MNGVIAWFVKNPIAANLLMLLIVIGGISSFGNMNREMFPVHPHNMVNVTVPYPGAAPQEVEEQISLRLEEAVNDLDGIERVTTYSSRGSASMMITVIPDYDVQDMVNEVKARVDAINVMPNEAERPNIREQIWRRDILEVAVAAEMDEASLKLLGEQVRDALSSVPGADFVDVQGTRTGELSVEVSEDALRRYNLTFEQIAAAIRNSSINLSAGQVRTEGGSIQLRTSGQAYTEEDFENIVVVQNPDGTRVRLGEVAKVKNSFEDVQVRARFNGKPAVFVEIYNVHDPDIISTARAVREKVEQLQKELPPGVILTTWSDRSVYLKDRVKLLVKNAIGGLALVFVLLMLFLRPVLAFWVAVGIAVAYLGALAAMPLFGVSINVLSLFAFLLILGIVVDDAIVVGESIHSHYEQGMRDEESAIVGARGVLKPVSVAVVTTLMVFGAMLLLPKQQMRLFTVMPLVALPALTISLMESFLILPAHLRHMKPEMTPRNSVLRWLHDTRLKFSGGMTHFANNIFGPFVTKAINQRFTTIAVFIGSLTLIVALLLGGWLNMVFFPQISGERIRGEMTLEDGLAWDQVLATAQQIESAVDQLRSEPEFVVGNNEPVVKNMRLRVRDSSINYSIELLGSEFHNIPSRTVEVRLRELIGDLDHVEEFSSRSSMGWRPRKDMSFQLSGPDSNTLKQATAMVRDRLARMPGVTDIEDSVQKGVPELEFTLKEGAESLGVGLSDIARQLRQGFYGEEAQRIPRQREDVKVMVRYPRAQRQDLETLTEFRVRTSDGREVPLDSVVEAAYGSVPPTVVRTDGKRSITVSADLLDDTMSVAEVSNALYKYFQEEVRPQYSRVSFELDGAEKDRQEFESEFNKVMLLVVLAIFGLIAIQFRSYWQPLLVLTAVPFGIAGAVVGHLVLGLDMSMMSLCGMLAAVGVVVNDNLVLIDRINHLRKEGWDAYKAVIQASKDRFRPIVLTSVTTFFGLMPILLERSTQAKFMIPTAVSLSWGVLSATFVTLLMVPCLYLMGENTRERIKRRLGGGDATLLNGDIQSPVLDASMEKS